ncbi:MAG: four helix bundle protein [Ignavibacteria bacterium]
MFGLTSQLRRASISIPSNISEGSARKSNIERKRFYEITRSSMVEIDTQIIISQRLKYLENIDLDLFRFKFIKLFKMLSGLIKNV